MVFLKYKNGPNLEELLSSTFWSYDENPSKTRKSFIPEHFSWSIDPWPASRLHYTNLFHIIQIITSFSNSIGRAKGTPDGMWTGMVGELMKDEADMGNFLAYRKVLKE